MQNLLLLEKKLWQAKFNSTTTTKAKLGNDYVCTVLEILFLNKKVWGNILWSQSRDTGTGCCANKHGHTNWLRWEEVPRNTIKERQNQLWCSKLLQTKTLEMREKTWQPHYIFFFSFPRLPWHEISTPTAFSYFIISILKIDTKVHFQAFDFKNLPKKTKNKNKEKKLEHYMLYD